MNFDSIEAEWAAYFTGDVMPVRTDEFQRLARATRRSQSRRRFVLIVCGFNLSLATLVCVYIGAFRVEVQAAEVLPLVGALVASWLAYGMLTWHEVSRARRAGRLGDALNDFVAYGLQQLRVEYSGMKIVAALMIVLYVLFLPWAVFGLMDSGKMDARAAVSFALLCGAQIVLFFGYCAASLRWSIAPRRKKLRALAEALGMDA